MNMNFFNDPFLFQIWNLRQTSFVDDALKLRIMFVRCIITPYASVSDSNNICCKILFDVITFIVFLSYISFPIQCLTPSWRPIIYEIYFMFLDTQEMNQNT